MISAVLLFIAISIPTALAVEDDSFAKAPTPKVTNEVNLTDAQKSELKQLSDKMFEIKKQMVEKYLEYGVITKEQAEKKLEKLEKMKKVREQNGFIPGKGRGKHWDKKEHSRQQGSEN